MVFDGYSLVDWVRLEVNIRPKERTNFIDFVKADTFINEVIRGYDEVSDKLKMSGFDIDFMEYQINSILDNRVMNNKKSIKQFNFCESLARFTGSSFKPFLIEY